MAHQKSGGTRPVDTGGVVVIRRLPTGGFEVDHHRRRGFTRVSFASEADAQAYAEGLSEAQR